SEAFINRDEQWSVMYKDFMSSQECALKDIESNTLNDFAEVEVEFSILYWQKEYERAIEVLKGIVDQAYEFSLGLGAWYSLWIGYCYEIIGDAKNSEIFYRRSYSANKKIPKCLSSNAHLNTELYDDQITNIANEVILLNDTGKAACQMASNLQYVDGSGTASQVEESIRYLGQYLGLSSTRPDKEFGTGPDNLWVGSNIALACEAKTGMKPGNGYTKKYVGQLAQHVNWVKSKHEKIEKIEPVFVGQRVPTSKDANPSNDMSVIEPSVLVDLSQKVQSLYADIISSPIPDIPNRISGAIVARDLVWETIIKNLTQHKLCALNKL
ncbi:hypothetical protein ACR9PT_14120, partial [Piscirickettsia salmonis]|uniref:hypothetical protein n=1 Tax=Piscirickettsia salmonis TaxID=1238 RepID=UPI003EBB89D5